MDALKINKLLSIIIIILSGIIIYYYINHNKLEHLTTSNEAIQNVGTNFSNINTTVSINKLGVKGAVNFTALRGIIVAWSGQVADIPDGWGYCDGSTYTALDGNSLTTPDLRSKFILGSSTKYPLNEQGGEETHVLSETEIPAHSHGYSELNIQNPNVTYAQLGYGGQANFVSSESSSVGGDPNNNNITVPHNNMPPYYALAFIMKL